MTPDPLTRILGARIANIRRAKGLSQDRLGELTGLDRSYISAIERGVANPSLSVLRSIAEALEIDLCSLLCKEVGHE